MEIEISQDKLTQEEAWNVLEFANAIYQGFNSGFYNPFTTSQHLVNLNNNPVVPTYEKVINALKNNPIDAELLGGYSQFMEVFDTLYGKLIRYYESLLSFDLSYTCINVKDPKEYKSEEYKKDLRRVHKFLDNFDYKQEFRKVLNDVLKKQTCYVWFRDTHEINNPIDLEEDGKIKKNEKFALQIMPQKYCLLTGYFNNSQLLYDFDYSYFLNATVDINLFAPAIKRNFKELYSSDGKLRYVPSSQLSNRNGVFANYIQCNPEDGAYAFKENIGNFSQTPPFASALKDCLRNIDIEQLQYDKDLITANAILVGTIKTFESAKSGTSKDQFSISPQTLGKLMQLVASALKRNIKPIALPLDSQGFYQASEPNRYMVEDANINTSRKTAVASSMIYTNDKMAQMEFIGATESDYMFMKKLYPQFSNFLNFFVNKKTVKYKFDFEFDGLARSFYREEKRKALNELFAVGIIPNESYISSVYGIKPQSFSRMIEESKNGDLQDKLFLLMNKNTAKDSFGGDKKEVGNQRKDNGELSDNGALSQEYQL